MSRRLPLLFVKRLLSSPSSRPQARLLGLQERVIAELYCITLIYKKILNLATVSIWAGPNFVTDFGPRLVLNLN